MQIYANEKHVHWCKSEFKNSNHIMALLLSIFKKQNLALIQITKIEPFAQRPSLEPLQNLTGQNSRQVLAKKKEKVRLLFSYPQQPRRNSLSLECASRDTPHRNALHTFPKLRFNKTKFSECNL